MGAALARQFARASVLVAIANTRGPQSLLGLQATLGNHVVPQALSSALNSTVLILAVPFPSVSSIARSHEDWSGRIVVDATNAIDFPSFTPTDLGGRASSDVIAEQFHGARLVKAFNTLPAATLALDPREGPGRRVIFMSGDDAGANSEVEALIAKLGFAPISLGSLDQGGPLQQFGGPLALQNLFKVG